MAKEIESSYFKTIFSKVIVALIIIISFYGIIDTGFKSTFLETFSHNLFGIYNNLVLFVIFTANIIYIYKYYSKASYFIVRLKNQKNFKKTIHKSILYINSILYVLYIIIGLIIASFLNFKGFKIEYYDVYNIPLVFYIIFGVIKIYLLLYCLSLISEIIMRITRDYKYLIFYVLIIFYLLYFIPYNMTIISSIQNIPLTLNYYFVGFRCSYFFQEVLFSFYYIASLFFIINIFSKFICKGKGDYNV